jgi:uncharacterized protein YciI
MFIVMLHYIKPLEHIETFLMEHRAFLDRYFNSGIFVASGPKVPRTGGVILARASTRDDLDRILEQDPFYRENLARYDITEFTPSKFARGAEELLAANVARR